MAREDALVTSFTCRRLRPALVDLAVGTLSPEDARRVEAHVASCATCRDDLEAMRGLSTELRDPTVPEPAEDFWRRQRQAIMRSVRTVPDRAPRPAPWRRWQLVGAFATVALAVLVSRTAFMPTRPTVHHSIDRLDDDALDHLHDLLPAIAPASTIEDADGDMLAVHDLDDDEIDSLADLIEPAS
jgi:anti-sigma factor RsiW